MPQIVHEKKKRPHLLLIGMGVLAALAVASLAIWYLVIPGGESVANTIARAQSEAKIEGKAAVGEKVLEDRLNHTWLPNDRAQLQLADGNMYLNDFKYDPAIKALESARQGGVDPLEVEKALAQAYQGAGNNAKAREYYQKVVDYYASPDRKNSPDSQSQKEYYAGELELVAQ